MGKDFRTRKVKFFVIERRNIEIPRIVVNEERTNDMFDIEEKMWTYFTHRGTNDFGYMNREKPKVQLGWSHLITNKEDIFEFKIRKLNDIIGDVTEATKIDAKTPFIQLSQIVRESLPNAPKEIINEDVNQEIYREKVNSNTDEETDHLEQDKNKSENKMVVNKNTNQKETKHAKNEKLKINAKIVQK